MSIVHAIDHPLVQAKITAMRDRRTPSSEFRRLLRQTTQLMGFEATRDLPTRLAPIETPLVTAELPVLDVGAITLAPILRAGAGMVEGMLEVVPEASVGYIGMYRDEATLRPVEYLCKLPGDVASSLVIVLDPMLATGGSAIDAVDALKARGCASIRMMNLLAAPEGLEAFGEAHPDVPVYVGAIDEGLNERAYITPGLGDAGDRIFGTEG